MNNSKYFVPELSDLHVGYECELHDRGEYATEFCGTQSMWEDTWLNPRENDTYGYKKVLTAVDIELVERGCYNWGIRTKYLTAEQIEDEGWILKINKTWDYEFEMHCHYNTYFMSFSPYQSETERELLTIGYNPEEDFQYIYKGTCPSINEFRKIISLLEFE